MQSFTGLTTPPAATMIPAANMSSSRPAIRATACAVLTVLLAGPLFGVVHELGARHHYCLEHGAIEETAAAAAGPVAEGEPHTGGAREAPPQGTVARSASERPEHGHARCLFDPAAVPLAISGPDGVAVAAAAPPGVTAWRPSPTRHHVRLLLRFAPKTSPPQSASV